MINEGLIKEQPATGNLTHIFGEVKREKYWFISCIFLSLVLSILYLRSAAYTYTAEIKIVPANSPGNPLGNAFSDLASVAGVNSSSGDQVAPIDLYKAQIISRVVADRLSARDDLMRRVFAAEWDADSRRWRQPPSSTRAISRFIKRMIGIPISSWHRPDGARLQGYIAGAISLKEQIGKPIVTIQFDHADPKFAVAFLSALHQTTDAVIRQNALKKSTQNIAYLKATLPTVSVIEQRVALSSLLSEQENTKMLASSTIPYAAEVIDPPFVSETPTKPQPFLVLVGSIMISLAMALGVVLVRFQLKKEK